MSSQSTLVPPDTLRPFELGLTVPDRPPRTIIEPYVTEGLHLMRRGAYKEAGQQFRLALALQPQNVAVNFLNSMTYHLLGSQGYQQSFDLAAVGYEIALRFDPNAWWAAFLYGAMELERQHYLVAQDLFAQAVNIRPDEEQVLLGLAIASYYVGDLGVADAAIQRARDLSAEDTQLLRPSALISAALGDDQQAQRFAERYQLTPADPLQAQALWQRLQDWQRSYAQVDISQEQQPSVPAIATPPIAGTARTGPRQIIIDAVVIRSIQSRAKSRGVNLFDGLGMQYRFSRTKTTTDTTGSDQLVSKIVTHALGISEINYSINIFNATDSRIDIIARPSLLSFEGVESSFFSGTLFIASLQGTLEASALSERVGVTLKVTPTFITDEEFLLDVYIEDADFTPAVIPGTFEQALLVSIAESTVTVRIRLGQTLLLAGLTELGAFDIVSKVPILGDIPLIQTFFKRKEIEETTNETMILLTPRTVIEPTKHTSLDPRNVGSQRAADLLSSYLQPITPAHNYDHLLVHLGESEYFQRFRRGDLRLEIFENERLDRLWNEVLAYLYF